jgi:Rad3-related DNA helicase
MDKDILGHFPFETFRPNQKETISQIDKAFNSGKRFAVLDVQTGGGKSAIGLTHARYMDSAYILTPQKVLQDQYMRDFGGKIVDLKGRNAYECLLAPRFGIKEKIFCHRGLCKQQGKSKLPECVSKKQGEILCPYFKRLAEAKESPITLFNFKSFLFQANYARQFGKRKLLIIDEAHNTESQLMDFVVISLSDKDFAEDHIVFPSLDSPKKYLAYFESINLAALISGKQKQAKRCGDFDLAEKWEELALRYESFVDNIEHHEFISEYRVQRKGKHGRPYRVVTLKPLFVKQYAEQMLFSYGEKIILMSATILDHRVFCESLGILLDKVEYIRVPSTFPVKNRLIRLRYAGNMNYKEKQATLPKLVEKIEGGLEIHKNERGIIHTHSFEITNYIRANINRKYLPRLLFQEDFPDKDALLIRHAELVNSVIVAPAMHEGLDLKDSLSRFQMICKVPYPDGKNDKQLRERMKLSWHYYVWLTCLKLVQSYGRSVRSETDYANTYILDAQFEKFYKQARKMLPAWFIDAILWH